MTQGERVKAIRTEKKMTMEQFGEKLGVQKSAISKIEKGERSLTNQMFLSICREFGVNEVWLRTGEGGIENMFTKLSDDDRYSINLGKLSITENQLAKICKCDRRGISGKAETYRRIYESLSWN